MPAVDPCICFHQLLDEVPMMTIKVVISLIAGEVVGEGIMEGGEEHEGTGNRMGEMEKEQRGGARKEIS